MDAEQIDKAVVPIVERLNHHGVDINVVVLKRIYERFVSEFEFIENEIHMAFDVDLHSKASIRSVFLSEGFIDVNGSMDDTVLQGLEVRGSKFAPLLRKWRSVQRKVGTGKGLLDACRLNGVRAAGSSIVTIYPEWKVSGTVTGRINCAGPSIVLVDKAYREAIVPKDGYKFVSWDWSAFELRVGASIARCKEMMQMFNEDVDPHTFVAGLILEKSMDEITAEERSNAKEISLGIWYGLSDEGIAQRAGLSLEKAVSISRFLKSLYYEILEAIESTKSFAVATKSVITEFGRKREFDDAGNASRSAWATRVQGTAADLFKLALIRMNAAMEVAKLAIPLYDGAIYEVPENEVVIYKGYIQAIAEKQIDGFCKFKAIMKSGSNWVEVS